VAAEPTFLATKEESGNAPAEGDIDRARTRSAARPRADLGLHARISGQIRDNAAEEFHAMTGADILTVPDGSDWCVGGAVGLGTAKSDAAPEYCRPASVD
jgi:hypothetical protein